MQYGLFVPPFGELADPGYLAELASRAEVAGWDGIFLWDHMVFPGVEELIEPWVALAAMAVATKRIRLGPMVTPVPRRRPTDLAREAAALDLLSRGRLTLGVGLGDLVGGEFSTIGEAMDPRLRASILDESLELMGELFSGQEVDHQGATFHVRGATFRPRPQQRPLPIWVAARWPKRAPLRRAVRFQGVFVIQVHQPSEIEEMRTLLAEFGLGSEPFDVVVSRPPGTDPRPWEAAGATWFLYQLGPRDLRRAGVGEVVGAGPPLPRTRATSAP